MPLKTNKCCCGGSSSPSHSPSSSQSSSPSASPEPTIIIEDCGLTAQYEVTVSGIVGTYGTLGVVACESFNRTWTLSYDPTAPSGFAPTWSDYNSILKYALLYYDEPYHVLGFGPHGLYVFDVSYIFEGNWDCGIGATNVFNRNYAFAGCLSAPTVTSWPASMTVTRIV